MEYVDYGTLELRIEPLLSAKGISKNKLCKDLDIPRSNLNRYCQNKFQRMDCALLCKLCNYLGVSIDELLTYHPPK